jgi:hypothetical protein
MKIIELQIGNYVEHKDDGIIKVAGIVDDANGLIKCDKGNWHHIKDIGPIAISEHWIIKLGFHKLGDVAQWELPMKGILEEITIGVDFSKEGDVYAICVHDDISSQMIQVEMSEVHELQNLISINSIYAKILAKKPVL